MASTASRVSEQNKPTADSMISPCPRKNGQRNEESDMAGPWLLCRGRAGASGRTAGAARGPGPLIFLGPAQACRLDLLQAV